MNARDFTDEILMAYADGELDEEATRRVDAAIARDEDVARRVALFGRTREAVAAVARARSPGPVPDALLERIRSRLSEPEGPERPASRVVPFRPRARSRPAELALAAGIALAVGVGTGLVVSPSLREDEGRLAVGPPGASELASALAELPAGASRSLAGGDVTLIATFLNEQGELCREFEYAGRVGPAAVSVACHTGSEWHVRFAVAASGGSSGYVPAASLETLDAYFASIGAEPPLPEDEEAAALEALAN